MALQQPSGKKIPVSAWRVVIILSSVATMVMYAETMLVPAIPDLINDFNISYSTLSWILITYLITGAVMTPIAGKLSDIYGKKKILLIISENSLDHVVFHLQMLFLACISCRRRQVGAISKYLM